MTCSACGKENIAATPFCSFCGAPMAVGVPAAALPVRSSGMAAASASNAGKATMSFLSSLSLAEKFAIAGPVIAFLGFFLPFVHMPDLATMGGVSAADLAAAGAAGAPVPDVHAPSLSLFGLAKYSGAVYFILLGAILSGGLFYRARGATRARRLLINGFQIMIGSMVGPGTLLALLFASMVRSMVAFGFWVVSLGFCCIVVGGLMTIARLAKSEV